MNWFWFYLGTCKHALYTHLVYMLFDDIRSVVLRQIYTFCADKNIFSIGSVWTISHFKYFPFLWECYNAWVCWWFPNKGKKQLPWRSSSSARIKISWSQSPYCRNVYCSKSFEYICPPPPFLIEHIYAALTFVVLECLQLCFVFNSPLFLIKISTPSTALPPPPPLCRLGQF